MNLVVIGGSDAGISAGLRAREVDPSAQVTLIVADAYPNFSICGIPYFISGDIVDWRDLAHRTQADLDAAGLQLRLNTRALFIDADRHQVGRCDRGRRAGDRFLRRVGSRHRRGPAGSAHSGLDRP